MLYHLLTQLKNEAGIVKLETKNRRSCFYALAIENKNFGRHLAGDHCPPVEPSKFIFHEYRGVLREGGEEMFLA